MRRIITPPISQAYEIQHKLCGLLVFTAVSVGLMSLVRVYCIYIYMSLEIWDAPRPVFQKTVPFSWRRHRHQSPSYSRHCGNNSRPATSTNVACPAILGGNLDITLAQVGLRVEIQESNLSSDIGTGISLHIDEFQVIFGRPSIWNKSINLGFW